jgi:hypothetical protein
MSAEVYFSCRECGWQFIDTGRKGYCDNCNASEHDPATCPVDVGGPCNCLGDA